MPHFIVENIEFDFTDSMGTITEQEQEFICLLYTSDAADDA